MIHVLATIQLNPDSRERFLQVLNANIPAVLAEVGCLEYLPAVDVDSGIASQDVEPNRVMVVEKWESLDALKAHLQSPHMLEYKLKVQDLVSSVSLKILQSA